MRCTRQTHCEVLLIRIRVLLADDSEITRRAIRCLLDAQREIEVVGEAVNFAQTIQMANELKPQVIVMDLHMPDETKVTPQDVKHHLNHGTLLLAISLWDDADTKALADRLGAAILLDKKDLGNELFPTIMRLVLPDATGA
jgi:DNA-binding NarL/FixJ family response regulator